jgi:hypothetical protein
MDQLTQSPARRVEEVGEQVRRLESVGIGSSNGSEGAQQWGPY